MDSDQRSQRDEGFVRRYEYDDGALIVADLGPETTDVSVDVLEDAVIVVTGDDQYEFDVADGDAEAFMKNGVLTIDVTEA